MSFWKCSEMKERGVGRRGDTLSCKVLMRG